MKIITNSNPYVLDYIEDANNLPALTRKNVDFVEAMVHIDSNYRLDNLSPNNALEKYYYTNENYTKTRNNDFAAFWFDKMKNGGDFHTCLQNAITSIDRANSTHLEAAINGRTTICERICNICKNYKDLISLLNKKFCSTDTHHLIYLITAKMASKKTNQYRFNLSFASKFCEAASKYLGAKVQYSKYDNVVADNLYKYANAYLHRNIKKDDFKIKSNLQGSTDKEKLSYRLKIYENYHNTIGEILHKLKNDYHITITREEFDHVIWYINK